MLDTNENIIRPDTKTNSFFFERVRVVVPAIVPYLNQEVWMQYIPDTYQKQLKKSIPVEKSDILDFTTTTITL
jgi:membrane protein required for colicin V production